MVRWLEPGEVLSHIPFGWLQWCITVYGAIAYSQFVVHTMTPTLSQESLWLQWPDLATARARFNGVFVGQAIARIVAGLWLTPLVDIFGRRLFVWCSVVSAFALSVACMAAPNFEVYAVLRTLVILIAMPAGNAASVYVVEMVHTRNRALTALIFQLIGTSYVIYATGVKWALDDRIDKSRIWRWTQLYFHLPALAAAILALVAFHETPRFLLSVRRDREAAWKVFERLSHGRINEVFDKEEVRYKGIDDVEGAATPVSRKAQLSSVFNVKKTVREWQKLFSAQYCRLTCAMLSIWFFTAFSHWGLTSYCTLFFKYLGVNVNLVTMLSYAVQLPFHVGVYFMMNSPRCGRIFALRWTSLAGAVVAGVLSACVRTENAGLLSTLAVATLCMGSILWGPVYSYSSERYPVELRGAAMGLFSATNGLSTVISTYAGSIGIKGVNLYVMPLVWGLVRLAVFASTYLLDVEVLNNDLGEEKH